MVGWTFQLHLLPCCRAGTGLPAEVQERDYSQANHVVTWAGSIPLRSCMGELAELSRD